MSDLYAHMHAWGVPGEYVRDHHPRLTPESLDEPLCSLVREVERVADWQPIQTRAVVAMTKQGDAHALRAWDRDALVRQGESRANGDIDSEDESEAYAAYVMEALVRLAAAVETH